jgi:hypothetical protein
MEKRKKSKDFEGNETSFLQVAKQTKGAIHILVGRQVVHNAASCCSVTFLCFPLPVVSYLLLFLAHGRFCLCFTVV